jgi:putative transposase
LLRKRNRKIDRCNQVWALGATYVPMARGFVYLTAVVDWASRRVADYLTWYNRRRPHFSLADRTPDEAYFAMLRAIKMAA